MIRFQECPCHEEKPDPCPRCGATVAGNDPVHGICQAGAGWDRATTLERERCIRAIRGCASLDENGYICEKAEAIRAIEGRSHEQDEPDDDYADRAEWKARSR